MPIQSVCVYCGAATRVAEPFKDIARTTGQVLAAHGKQVVYGGGHVGLMGLLADSALKAGGKVVGIIPEHIRSREIQHTGLTELHVVPDMHTRKRMMVERADAFLILPGGFGTLDETFEILTWKQLHLHAKPVVILNVEGYWDPLIALIDNIVKTGFAQPDNLKLFTVVESIDAMLDALEKVGTVTGDVATKWM